MITAENPNSIFTGLIKKHQQAHQEYSKQYTIISWIRISLFIAGIATLAFFVSENNYLGLTLSGVAIVVLFGAMVTWHNKVAFLKEKAQWLVQINEEEVQRLERNFDQLNTGEKYQDKAHPFTYDLNVFGSHSLFQLINHTTTLTGEAALVKALAQHLPSEMLPRRQEALKELASMVELRQKVEAVGRYFKNKDSKSRKSGDLNALYHWLGRDEKVRYDNLMKTVNWMAPSLLIALLIAFPANISLIFSIGFVFNFSIILLVSGKIKAISEEISKVLNQIRSYRHIIGLIDGSDFHSEELIGIKSGFTSNDKPATKVLSSLEKILENFEVRSNLLYAIVNIIFLLDLYWYRRAMAWKALHGQSLLRYTEAVGQFELCSSLAAFAHAHPQYTWPTFAHQEKFHLSATGLGHPLIEATKSVTNNFDITGRGAVALITGSNMSGKSTFLRTLGINTVLAQMGCPVFAKSMKIAPIQLFTGMFSQDNLSESVSSFYAELRRLQALLQLTDQIPVLYLLDEILKGTNSDDRYKGGVALIRQLAVRECLGLVSTHDLGLGKLEGDLANFKNYSFNSLLSEGEIVFDYTICAGVCRSFNASVLMEKMGIIPKPNSF